MAQVTIAEQKLTEMVHLAIGDFFEFNDVAWMVVDFICREGAVTSVHIKRVSCDDRDTLSAETRVRKLKLVEARFERE